jgi:hypothetical protein
MLMTKFHCLQEILPSDPVDQGDEGDWEKVGEPAGRDCNPAPTVEELVSQLTHQSTTVVEPQAPVVEGRTEPTTTLLLKSQWLLKPKKRRMLQMDLSTSPTYLAPRP